MGSHALILTEKNVFLLAAFPQGACEHRRAGQCADSAESHWQRHQGKPTHVWILVTLASCPVELQVEGVWPGLGGKAAGSERWV